MIRLVFMEVDNTLVAVGACEHGVSHCKTFDIEAPEVEAWATETLSDYRHRGFIGMEVIEKAEKP